MPSFLQSREWAGIQGRDGRKAHRVSLDGVVYWIYQHNLPAGFFYWYIPRPDVSDARKFLESAVRRAAKEGAVFLKIEPDAALPLESLGFSVHRVSNPQLEKTLVLGLRESDEELLSRMHPKTRYNIKLSMRHGVAVEQRAGSDALDSFYDCLRETASRDGFRLHSKAHYEHLLQFNSHEFSNELFFAMHEGAVAAAAMVNFYKGRATYLHGASRYSLRSVMAPYLMHWAIIREAKKRGYEEYDFWGADESKWPGVTRFKRGFGGSIRTYPPASDIVLRPFWYYSYQTLRRVRRLL